MWIKFLEDFRWKPNAMSAKVWPKGYVTDDVPAAAAEAAIAAGKAEETDKPEKPAKAGKRPGTGRQANDEPAA